jgi:hypothetical protein
MKKYVHFLIIVASILICDVSVFAQSHELYLPRPTSASFLNTIIMGDTTATGARKDYERVYVLQRGAVWFFNGIINNIGWPLNIKAEEGPGAKPIIYAVVAAASDRVPNYFIQAEQNVTLKNIVVNGYFDLDQDYAAKTYRAIQNVVRYNIAGNYGLTIDGCVFLNAVSSHVGIFGAIRSIKATNNIFANFGVYPTGNVGNGRAFDLRNTSIDTVYIVNNSFVNGYDRVIRHIASTGRLKNFLFDHNTIYNIAGIYGVIALGLVGDNVRMRDNLFVDPMCSASDTVAQRQFDFRENGEIFSPDLPGKVKQAWIYSQNADSGYVTKWDIENNYWNYSPAIVNKWNEMKTLYRPLLKPAPIMTDLIQSKVANPATAFINLQTMSFTNAPKTMEGFVSWFLSPSPEGSNELNSGGNFIDQDRRTSVYYMDTMKLSYSTSSAAYTGASKGYPAGDLNWFPDRKAAWIAGGGTDVTTTSVIPDEFSLEQNYPNPFNPTTKITYNIPKESRVKLEVFNILGQRVATLVNDLQIAGLHSVDFDASEFTSGVYVYRLITQDYSISKKMVLMK